MTTIPRKQWSGKHKRCGTCFLRIRCGSVECHEQGSSHRQRKAMFKAEAAKIARG